MYFTYYGYPKFYLAYSCMLLFVANVYCFVKHLDVKLVNRVKFSYVMLSLLLNL